MPIELNLPPQPAEAHPGTRLAPSATKRPAFRPDSSGAWPTGLPTVSWHEPDFLLPPKPEGTTEFLAPNPATTPVLEDFDKASLELRIHTANVCLNRRGHKTSPAKPARSLARVRLKALLYEGAWFRHRIL